VSPYLDVYSVTIANILQNSISVPINIGSSKQTVETLIDSSAGGLFIDQNFAKNFDINYLDEPVKAYNMDGTENKWGTINAYVNLEFFLGKQKFKECFYVTGLGKQRIILGFPWLHRYNLIINWKKGEITFKPFQIDWRRLMEKGKRIRQEQQPKIEEVVDKEESRNWTTLPLKENKMGVYIELLETDVWIHKTNIATELAIEENSKKTDKTDEQLVPAEYHEYLDIFSEEKAHRFPNRDLGITRSKWRKVLNLNRLKTIILHWQNNSNWTNSQRKISKKGISGHLNHQWPPHFSLFPRKMENFDHVRTTGI
jgi:hypothetical protein